MRVRVVIQSRLSSSRLPGKALLTLVGRPLVVLAAQRASNTGLEVVVATSAEPEDDVLAAALTDAGVPVFRGDLHDTLHRFAAATADLDDADLVVRLTGDNVGPDGTYVAELIDRMQDAGEDYIRVTTDTIYGLGAEVFTVGLLRTADREADAPYDREHVTPWIRRHSADLTWVPPVEGAAGRVRCTVDTLLDFTIAAKALAGVEDPLALTWRELLDRWVAAGGAMPAPLPGGMPNPLAVGPWVLDTSGLGELRDAAEASRVLELAAASGVTHLETSLAHAGSAPRVGQALAHGLSERVGVIVTLPPGMPEGVDGAVWEAMARLRVGGVDVVATAGWSDFVAHGDELVALNAQSVARALGSVVVRAQELTAALADRRIGYLEVAPGLLDQLPAEHPEIVVAVRCQSPDEAQRALATPGVTTVLLAAASPAQVRDQATQLG
ncbi:cytidylyltransferase domain-containing protein [Flexivirga meconopsidis]|uniref:cytidylyltransferase domain-containing protein n=1 Tax=Flexivirga meconopsidis TaxID=2977121 RepID=UPI00223F1C50|nr:NTP transferase domain-containing protein [Flexivirga meconopsidis]